MPLECGDKIWRQKTGITELPYGVENTIVDRTMWAVGTVHEWDRRTDGRTDKQTDLRFTI